MGSTVLDNETLPKETIEAIDEAQSIRDCPEDYRSYEDADMLFKELDI